MKVKPVDTPIQESVIKRVSGAIMNTLRGWLGPGDPPNAVAPAGTPPRALDYPVGINTMMIRKNADMGAIEHSQLRALADACTGLRAVLETRKDTLATQDWAFVLRKQPGEPKALQNKRSSSDSRIKELTDFFMFPDKERDWATWIRQLAEDALVLDAATIYMRPQVDGKPYALEVLDGSTIALEIDERGRTPETGTAFFQVIAGVPAVPFTRDELLYHPRNKRPHKFMGFSPVEQLTVYINIQLRRTAFQLFHYTEGNMPAGLLRGNKDWTPHQIREMNEIWNEMLAGNAQMRSRAMWIPDAGDPVFPQSENLKDEFDEWIMRMICYVFGVSPNIFIKQQNRASAQTYWQEMDEQGLVPWLKYTKQLIDMAIQKWWGYTDIEFEWHSDKELDAEKQASIDTAYINAGVYTAAEVRERLGMAPMTEEQQDEQARLKDAANPERLAEGRKPGEKSKEQPEKKFGKADRGLLRRGLRDEEIIERRSKKLASKLEQVLAEKIKR